MSQISLDEHQIKEIFKQALREFIQEDKQLFRNLLTEIIEDMALVKAIQEGEQTELVSRDSIFKLLNTNYES